MSREKVKISKTTAWILGILVVLAIAVWVAIFQVGDKNLHLYFLDVGQGDSIYVREGNKFDLLIDGGPDKSVLSELGEIMPFYDRKIDLVVLTHPHSDHVSGLIEVLKRYQVGEIWLTDAVHTSPEYLEFLKTIKEKQVFTKTVGAGDKKIGGYGDKELDIKILWPEESYKNQKVANLNNTSIVLKLTYGSFSVLFTGDAEEEVQQQLLFNNGTMEQLDNVTILKMPHHGSSNAAYEPFIKIVKPEIAIISVGEHNKFGHPAESTIKLYKDLGAKIYRTDLNGRIKIISNGHDFW